MRDLYSTTTSPRQAEAGAAHARGYAALRAPAPEFVHDVAQLRTAVVRHVRDRRGDGVPLDRVLVEMTALVEQAEGLAGSPDELGVLLGQVRRWSLDAYLDEPALQHVPRFY